MKIGRVRSKAGCEWGAKLARVFLSYAREDQALARQLADDLRNAGLEVWSDLDIRAGDNWVARISAELNFADIIVVLVTPISVSSNWVSAEWMTALARSKRIIPLIVGDATLPPLLHAVQAIELGADRASAVRAILGAAQFFQVSPEPPASDFIEKENLIRDVADRVIELLGAEGRRMGRRTSIQRDEELVFVIISFSPDMEPIFEAISDAAQSVGLRAERVKETRGDYRITDRMLEMIRAAKIIVADLTHERPNVYFELGYARGMEKSVVTILRDGTEVHFDVRDWNYIAYADSRPLERALRERFKYELDQI